MARLAVPAGLGLIAIVVAVCINTVHASRNVTIGWLGPTSGPYASFLSPCLYATWRAIDVANAANLIPGTTLQLVVGDSATDNTQTLAATYQLVQPQAKGGAGAVAIVGEFFSSLTILAAEVLNPYKTALVSPSATATDFSVQHSSNFPYFVGAQPNNAFQALQISQFVKANGWKRVAMLFTTDSYGSSGAAATAVELTKLGIDIVVSTSCSSKTDVDFSLDRIAATTARIIIYWGAGDDDSFRAVIRSGTARTPPMFGNATDYQWIASEGATNAGLAHDDTTSALLPDIADNIRGVIGMKISYDLASAGYAAFAKVYQSGTDAHGTSVDITTVAATDPASINSYAAFTYDAISLVIQALRTMIVDLSLDPTLFANKDTFYSVLTNTTLPLGATGNVIIDAQGNRLTGFLVTNYQSETGEFAAIGTLSGAGEFVPVSDTPAIVWMGGVTHPVDTPVRTILALSHSITYALRVVAGIIVALTLVIMGTIFFLRHMPVFKASSPLFLLLMCTGTVLLCSSVFARTLESHDSSTRRDQSCVADLWLTNIGYSLIAGSLLLKEWRIQQIFLMKTLQGASRLLQDWHLLAVLVGILLCEVALLLGLQFGGNLHSSLFSANASQDYYACSSDADSNLVSVFLPVTISTRFFLLVLTVICVYRIRDVPAAFNETRSITVTVYNLLFLSILLPAIDAAMDRGKDAALIAYSICVFVIVAATILILIAPKLLVVYKAKFGSGDFSGRLTTGGNHTRVTGDDSSLTTMDGAQKPENIASGQRQSIGGAGGKISNGGRLGVSGGTTAVGISSTLTSTGTSGRRTSTQAGSPVAGRSSIINSGVRLPAPLPVTRNPKLPEGAPIPPAYDSPSPADSPTRAGHAAYPESTPQRAGPAAVQLAHINVNVDVAPGPPQQQALSPRSALRLHLPVAMADDLTLFVQHKAEFLEWRKQQEAVAAASPSASSTTQ